LFGDAVYEIKLRADSQRVFGFDSAIVLMMKSVEPT
jgi:hypothetical protein